MNSQPLVTVVVPVFNGEKYIDKCLDCLLKQSYKNLEIIVVNDGSSDNSEKIIKKYPVQLINHEKNSGLSASRNTGIDAATGEYIHFMDVDDTVNDTYYEAMVEAIVSTGVDVACSGMIHERNRYKTQRFKTKEVFVSTKDKFTATYVGKWGFVWRYLFRLNFLKENNLRFEEGRFIEDLPFSVPALYFANKLVTVPKAEYYYYYSPNSILNNKDKTHQEKRRVDLAHANQQVMEFAKKHNFKIPGVNTGRTRYLLRKVYYNLLVKP